ncbi:peptidoglycan editing factor PgeF [Emcibacter sp.]|uniref:peptidoglycan editing factor PgeF n=1 Tax=Emcibacter sp. TaxID=1979954 RepID=UPI003A8F2158
MSAEFLTSPLLNDVKGIRHGFFTRNGGSSSGIYESLNCGIGSRDYQEDVLANRQACLEAIGAADATLCGVYQVHSTEVLRLERPWELLPNKKKADAIVTKQKNVAISILTADCAPVLLADQSAGVIAAAHAGWQGAFNGVLENTLREMEFQGAKADNISAAIGPCITQKTYEVGPEFRDRFIEQSPDNDNLFAAAEKQGHFMFDLQGYIRDRLVKAGIGKVDSLDHDTYAEEDKFFSYRRSTHRKETDYGRQISMIMLS